MIITDLASLFIDFSPIVKYNSNNFKGWSSVITVKVFLFLFSLKEEEMDQVLLSINDVLCPLGYKGYVDPKIVKSKARIRYKSSAVVADNKGKHLNLARIIEVSMTDNNLGINELSEKADVDNVWLQLVLWRGISLDQPEDRTAIKRLEDTQNIKLLHLL